MKKFRYDPVQLFRTYVMEHQPDYIEKSPNFWLSADYQRAHQQQSEVLETRYFHGWNITPSLPYHILRISNTPKGVGLFLERAEIRVKRISISHPKYREGYRTQAYPVKQILETIFLSPTGVCRINGKKILTLDNYTRLINAFSGGPAMTNLLRSLLCIHSQHQWLEEYLKEMGDVWPAEKLLLVDRKGFNQMSSPQKMVTLLTQGLNQTFSFRDWPFSINHWFLLTSYGHLVTGPVQLAKQILGTKETELKTEVNLLLGDIQSMVTEMNRPKFRLGNRSIKEWHDQITRELNDWKIGSMVEADLEINPIYRPLVGILEENGIQVIRTNKELLKEGLTQHHCVASYEDQVNAGRCIIVRMPYGDKWYTGEIQFRPHQGDFYLNQLRGVCNDPAPEEAVQILKTVLEQNKPKVVYSAETEAVY